MSPEALHRVEPAAHEHQMQNKTFPFSGRKETPHQIQPAQKQSDFILGETEVLRRASLWS